MPAIAKPTKRRAGNPLTSIQRSRSGFSVSSFSALTKRMPFTLKEWAAYLHLSERSLQRYLQSGETIRQPYAERIYEIRSLFELGKEVFGDPKKFSLWLLYPSIALGRVTPASLLDTSEGVRFVADELHRIQHGIFA